MSDFESRYDDLWESTFMQQLPPPPPPPPPPATPKRRRGRMTAGVFALALVAVGAGAAGSHVLWPPSGSAATAQGTGSGTSGSTSTGGGSSSGLGQLPFAGGDGSGATGSGSAGSGSAGSGSSASGSTGTGPSDAAAIARNVDPGIVDINVTLGYQNAEAAGTGMVLTPTGEILTNNHVIEGATKISVTDVGNGRTYHAMVVGYDRSADIAVLQLTNASGLRTVTVGSSAKIRVGQAVVAVGNAGGQGGTPSYAGGTVTGLGQAITATSEGTGSSEQLTGLIETDADVVAGDSGGPLVDAQGTVIGMDTAASAGVRFSGSDGYAIPIDSALTIARQIEAGHTSSAVHVGQTAMLGVTVAGSAQQGNGWYGGSTGSTTAGVQIQQVMPGGAAAAAGLVSGDVITSLDGHAVTSPDALSALMTTERPGARVSLTYVDPQGTRHTTTVTLGTGPAQ